MTKTYIKNIIFTKTPLNGKYRYKDEFQIYPLNLGNAPNVKHTHHFPIIIEFWCDNDELPEVKVFEDGTVKNWMARNTVHLNKLIKITNLLSAISNYRFFFYRHPETYWSVPLPEKIDETINDISSIWSASLYYYPNIAVDLKMDKFSNPDFPSITLVTNSLYYLNPIEGRDKFIDFPVQIDDIITKYFQASGDELKVVDSSIYQICNGIDLFHMMKSLSFFSFVSSIETLVNYEFRNEKVEYECTDCKSLKTSRRKCTKCGNPIWGVTAKYREFLFKYVSSQDKAKKMYNKIYDIRLLLMR
jgi:hypothetical protein